MDRAKSAFGVLPDRFQETAESALATGLEVVEKFHNRHNGRIRASLSCRGVDNCTDELIQHMKRHAGEAEILVQAHAVLPRKHGMPLCVGTRCQK